MIITQLDTPLTAEEARRISLANRDDSADRMNFRRIMQEVKSCASFGYTRYQALPSNKDLTPSEHVQNALRSMGYKISVKRAYQWDEKTKEWSDKPWLDHNGREQFIVEITWG